MTLGIGSRLTYAGIGGSTGNVLSILAFFGWDSMPLVHLGRDRIGAAIHREFSQLGANLSHVRLDRGLTSPLLYQFAPQGAESPRYSFACPECGRSRRFSESLIDVGADDFLQGASRSNVFFFDRVTLGTVRLAEAARAGGAFVFFEPSAIGANADLFRKALCASHVVKYSAERLHDPFTDCLGAGFVEIQTLGAKGLRFRKHSLAPDWVVLPALPSKTVVDTSGAGDWCSAGFLHALFSTGDASDFESLTYNELYDGLRLGQAIAALSVGHLGARGLMRASQPSETLEMAQQVLAGSMTCSEAPTFAPEHPKLDSLCCETLMIQAKRLQEPLSLAF